MTSFQFTSLWSHLYVGNQVNQVNHAVCFLSANVLVFLSAFRKLAEQPA